MTTKLENQLRDDLRLAGTAVQPSAGFAARVVGAASRRQRPLRLAISAAAAAGGIAVVAVGVGVTDLVQRSDSTTRTEVTTTPPPESLDPRQVLAALPDGSPPERPISVNGALHDGTHIVPLPGRDGGVVDRVAGGWLVLAENRTDGAFTSTFGVLSPDGSFRELPSFPDRFTQEGAVSPDGNEVFTDSTVLDVRDDAVVDQLARPAATSVGWNQAGIFYTDRSARTYLWSPGADPVSVDAEVLAVAPDSDRVLLRGPRRGCTSVAVPTDGGLRTLLDGCVGRSPLYLSADGDQVLTRDLDVVSVIDGAVMKIPTLTAVRDAVESAGWEDDTHVLVATQTSGDRVQPVRCDVLAGTCERAGDPLTTREDVDFTSYAGEK